MKRQQSLLPSVCSIVKQVLFNISHYLTVTFLILEGFSSKKPPPLKVKYLKMTQPNLTKSTRTLKVIHLVLSYIRVRILKSSNQVYQTLKGTLDKQYSVKGTLGKQYTRYIMLPLIMGVKKFSIL